MSSGYGPSSKASATSDAYRNNPIWDKGKQTAPKPKTDTELLAQYKQLLQAALESLPVDSITYVAIELALGEK